MMSDEMNGMNQNDMNNTANDAAQNEVPNSSMNVGSSGSNTADTATVNPDRASIREQPETETISTAVRMVRIRPLAERNRNRRSRTRSLAQELKLLLQ